MFFYIYALRNSFLPRMICIFITPLIRRRHSIFWNLYAQILVFIDFIDKFWRKFFNLSFCYKHLLSHFEVFVNSFILYKSCKEMYKSFYASIISNFFYEILGISNKQNYDILYQIVRCIDFKVWSYLNECIK